MERVLVSLTGVGSGVLLISIMILFTFSLFDTNSIQRIDISIAIIATLAIITNYILFKRARVKAETSIIQILETRYIYPTLTACFVMIAFLLIV